MSVDESYHKGLQSIFCMIDRIENTDPGKIEVSKTKHDGVARRGQLPRSCKKQYDSDRVGVIVRKPSPEDIMAYKNSIWTQAVGNL